MVLLHEGSIAKVKCGRNVINYVTTKKMREKWDGLRHLKLLFHIKLVYPFISAMSRVRKKGKCVSLRLCECEFIVEMKFIRSKREGGMA